MNKISVLILCLFLSSCAMTQEQHKQKVLKFLEDSKGLSCYQLREYIDITINALKDQLK